MDLRQLEIVRAIAETGSFTGAGGRLHVSQSAISRQILLLEDEFHERLFVRLGRRVQITAAGEAILQLSHRVFNDIRDTSASITDKQKTLSGTLNLVGGMTVCLYVFPPLLTELKRQHPAIDLTLVTASRDLDVHVRMVRAELFQQQREDVEADGHPADEIQRSAQHFLTVGDTGGGVADVVEDAVAQLQQHLAGGGDLDAAAEAHEQPFVKFVLEEEDLAADGGLRHVQACAGPGE